MSSRVQEGSSSGSFDSNKIRVGHRYQADVPESPIYQSDTRDMATLVWTSDCKIPPEKIEQYLQVARDQYDYNDEQALGLLTWHKFDLDRAIFDLANYSPFPDCWSAEDKVLFEQAMQLNTKEFHKIQRFLPDKSIGQLVNYYYKWKKTCKRESELDRKSSSNSSKSDSSDTLSAITAAQASSKANRCSSCFLFISSSKASSGPKMCRECLILSKKIGKNIQEQETGLHKPRGIYIDESDLKKLALGEDILAPCDREIVRLRQAVQTGKQNIEALKKKIEGGIKKYQIIESSVRISPKWTNDEMLLAIQAFRSEGQHANFKSIADLVKTKTADQVAEFYISHKERFQLDPIIGFS